MRLLVTRLIPLNAADLEAWMNDPEEWVNGEKDEQWEFGLRVCILRDAVSGTFDLCRALALCRTRPDNAGQSVSSIRHSYARGYLQRTSW